MYSLIENERHIIAFLLVKKYWFTLKARVRKQNDKLVASLQCKMFATWQLKTETDSPQVDIKCSTSSCVERWRYGWTQPEHCCSGPWARSAFCSQLTEKGWDWKNYQVTVINEGNENQTLLFIFKHLQNANNQGFFWYHNCLKNLLLACIVISTCCHLSKF